MGFTVEDRYLIKHLQVVNGYYDYNYCYNCVLQ